MSNPLKLIVIIAAFAWTPSLAFGLGADQPKEEIARRAHCVYGYFVNWEDVFFYAGDTAALNEFLAAYSKMKGSTLKVVLHVGPQKAKSPWGTPKQDIDADWTYYVWNGYDTTANPIPGVPDRVDAEKLADPARKPAPSRVDVWLGRGIKLADLKIPENIPVESGGEIEKFIEQRKKPADAAPKPEKPSAPAPKTDEKPAPPATPAPKAEEKKGAALTPQQAVEQAGKGEVVVEFGVGEVGWLDGPIRSGDDTRPPVVVEWDNRLKNGGRFYLMLHGDAVGPPVTANPDARTKEFKGKGVRARGLVRAAKPDDKRSDYYITVSDAAKVEVIGGK